MGRAELATDNFRTPDTQAGRELLRDLQTELEHHQIPGHLRDSFVVFVKVGVLRVEREARRIGARSHERRKP